MDENKDINNELENKGLPPKKESGFNLPDSYFDAFMDRLSKKLEQEHNELASYPLLNSISKLNSFEVPVNYFENLKVYFNEEAELDSYATLAAIGKPSLLQPEEEYFESNLNRLQNKIIIHDELKEFSQLYLQNRNTGFVVANDYFDDLDQRIKERLFAAKPVSIWNRISEILFSKKMAYSFSFVLLLGLCTIWFLRNSAKDSLIKECNGFACLEKKDIINSNEINLFDEDELIELIDVNRLSDSLNLYKGNQNKKETEEEVIEQLDENSIMDQL